MLATPEKQVNIDIEEVRMLWTCRELKQLFLVTKRLVHNKATMQEVKSEIRWLEKKLDDRVNEILEGLREDSSPLTVEELEELLEGEEPEVVEEVVRQLREDRGGN